ncbi:MAG TPA: hypothetical protein VLK82_02495 [Candidatus Tectomicrobia bacterium]|nr:hypothetical protein [Candidatus Tectomicrobia bacterium]
MEENTTVVTPSPSLPPEVVEKVVIGGDLSGLNAAQRAEYYAAVCRSLGLNPLTKPFEYLTLNGKLRLYALRDCADQLRRLHGISIYIANRERMSDIYVVTARAKDRQGREDESTGAVTVGNLKGDALANALMKAETKAKRRVTLSIAGLGWLDETELETIPQTPTVVTSAQELADEVHPTADQISSLVELARSCGIDLISFGHHMRRLMDLAEETKITKKFLRESMTMAQYESAWQHYSAVLKKHVEEDVLDFPPPVGHDSAVEAEALVVPLEAGQQVDASESVSTSDAPPHSPYATPQQIARLKALAQQVGEDAYADVQDMLDHHRGRLTADVCENVKQRLRARKAAKKEEAAV